MFSQVSLRLRVALSFDFLSQRGTVGVLRDAENDFEIIPMIVIITRIKRTPPEKKCDFLPLTLLYPQLDKCETSYIREKIGKAEVCRR